MISYKTKTVFSQLLAMALGSMLTCSVGWVPTAWADTTARLIRIFETDDLFNPEFFVGVAPELNGWAFPPGIHTLLEQPAGGAATVAVVEPPKSKTGKVSETVVTISDAINMAFDSVANGLKGAGKTRVFLFEETTGELTAIKANANDVLDLRTVKRSDARPLAVTDAEGMTLDPKTGSLFILDVGAGEIVRVRAAPAFDGSSAEQIPLPSGLGVLRGLAFDPLSGQLFVFSPSAQMLYGLTVTGEMVAAVKPAEAIQGIQGMVFGPSADLTDDPAVFHLYIAADGGVSEWAL